ncbi:MAG TPA: DUF4397 domain-containing protein [Streptosporangiaceae bacterium]|nr:DUF4397 domain-containing protein [Streptosporangiaceae bacterium]
MNDALPSTARRAVAMLAPLLAALLLISGLLAAAPAGAAAAATGWIRLAHLSPNAPAVDVYLYNFGNPDARVVLHHVSYGTVSPYQQVPAGEYTVSMRAAGARGSAKPILSTGFEVNHGRAYTVAGMGPAAGLRLQVIDDTISAPAGHALVRVIQASLSQHVVTVSLGHLTLHQLDFASVSTYRTVAAGRDLAKVTGQSEQASMNMPVPADSTHTLVVLDGSKGLRITDLEDAAGSPVAPAGGAATGLGGTAPRPAPAPWPWLAVIAAGALLSLAGARRFRAARTTRA